MNLCGGLLNLDEMVGELKMKAGYYPVGSEV